MLKPTAVVELVWQDETGSTSATTLFAPSSATVADIDADATALASILAPLTGAVLIKQRIKYINVPETPVMSSGSAPITHTGVFFFETTTDAPDAIVMVPSIKEGLLVTDEPGLGVLIDIENADVVTFSDAVIGSGISNMFADDIIDLVTAYRQSRV